MSLPKRIGVVQSNYIPWKGYFDMINFVDEFILYDVVQYTKNDWRNRNKIKTPRGLTWMTIPVRYDFGQTIHETQVCDGSWARSHWDILTHHYSTAACFAQYKPIFKELYRSVAEEKFLSAINHRFLTAICDILGIKTRLTWAKDYSISGEPTERLVSLCRQAGATEYFSGPLAKDYMEEELFPQAGIKLLYMDYSGYPEYRQLYPPFEHGVSVLDLIFNEGAEAPRFMKSFQASRPLAAVSDSH